VDEGPDDRGVAGASPAPVAIPRLQLNAWREALASAATIPAVIEVVQQILSARWANSPELPSVWQPRDIRSREDIEHWARRIRSRPSEGHLDVHGLAPLCDLMRFALDRMNELGPRRR
jgi:hypothetical protein